MAGSTARVGSFAYAYITPQYVRQQLHYVWNTFRPSGVLVAEFGFNPYMEFSKTLEAQLYDLERTLYYQRFLREMLKSMYEDGVNVIGALAWSFVDNDEFRSHGQQYGLQHVNRTDGAFTRRYKRSFFDFVDFFQVGSIMTSKGVVDWEQVSLNALMETDC